MGLTELLRWLTGDGKKIEMMEARMAEDDVMIDRLRVASDKAATVLRDTQDALTAKDAEIADLKGQAAADSSVDAEKLRPVVEFLEGLGVDPVDPVPAVDPVPTDPTPVPGVEDAGTSTEDGLSTPETDPTAGTAADPGAETPGGGTVEQPGATTDAPLDSGTGEVAGGSAV